MVLPNVITRSSPASASASPLVRALRGDRPERTPVWFMRQAGRSLPEYREARKGNTMLEACLDPALVAEITAQPVRRHGVDAGILFSDIVVPLLLAGVDVTIEPGVGPVFARPCGRRPTSPRFPHLALQGDGGGFDRALDVVTRKPSPRRWGSWARRRSSASRARPSLSRPTWSTGGPSRDHLAARRLMIAEPETWDGAHGVGGRRRGPVPAGRRCSRGRARCSSSTRGRGRCPRDRYARIAPPRRRAPSSHVSDLDVPRIHFGTHTGHLLEAMNARGGDRDGHRCDGPPGRGGRGAFRACPCRETSTPPCLARPWEAIEAHVRDVVRARPGRPGSRRQPGSRRAAGHRSRRC